MKAHIERTVAAAQGKTEKELKRAISDSQSKTQRVLVDLPSTIRYNV